MMMSIFKYTQQPKIQVNVQVLLQKNSVNHEEKKEEKNLSFFKK